MDNQTVDTLKKWIEIDDKIRHYNDKIKVLREKKKEIEDKLLGDVEENDLIDTQINTGNGSIKFTTKTTTEGLTQRYVKKQLENFFKQNKIQGVKADDLYEFLLSNRKTTCSTVVDRKVKKEED